MSTDKNAYSKIDSSHVNIILEVNIYFLFKLITCPVFSEIKSGSGVEFKYFSIGNKIL